jgi:hypothetical protein
MTKLKTNLPIILGIVCAILAISGMTYTRPALAALDATIIYVDVDNTSGTYNGTSWATAYPNLQDALTAADSGDEIWVAEGVYYPDAGSGQINNAPQSKFNLESEVSLYGGFDPQTGVDVFAERDWTNNPTIFSGDVDGNDINTPYCLNTTYRLFRPIF